MLLACRNRELEGGTPGCMYYPMSQRCEHTQGLPLNWLTIGQLRASTLPVKWKLQRDRKTQVVGHCQLSWSVANYWLRGHLCRRAMIVRIDVEMYIQRKGTLASPFCMMPGSKSFRAPICRLMYAHFLGPGSYSLASIVSMGILLVCFSQQPFPAECQEQIDDSGFKASHVLIYYSHTFEIL